jgi:hypothetical protein
MSNVTHVEIAALAKATLIPALYFIFVAWSVTLLAS